MIRLTRLISRIGATSVLVAIAIASPSCAKGKTLAHPLTKIEQLIADVHGGRAIERATVERALGVTLNPVSNNPAFQTYEAAAVKLDALSLSVELRETIRGGPATAGSLLIVRVVEGCPRQADVKAHFAPLAVTDGPRGDSLDEETYWSRREQWGELSFGFAERAPDCLSSIIFAANDPV